MAEIPEQNKAQFTHKLKAAVSCQIWTIFQR